MDMRKYKLGYYALLCFTVLYCALLYFTLLYFLIKMTCDVNLPSDEVRCE